MDKSIAEVAYERNQGACGQISLYFAAVTEEKDVAWAERNRLFWDWCYASWTWYGRVVSSFAAWKENFWWGGRELCLLRGNDGDRLVCLSLCSLSNEKIVHGLGEDELRLSQLPLGLVLPSLQISDFAVRLIKRWKSHLICTICFPKLAACIIILVTSSLLINFGSADF